MVIGRAEVKLAAGQNRGSLERGLADELRGYFAGAGPIGPRHLQILDVASVNLRRCRVTSAAEIAAVGWPTGVMEGLCRCASPLQRREGEE